MNRKGHFCRKLGFTLVELLAVVVIIAVLASITLMTGKYVYRKINYKKAMDDLTKIQLAVEAFYSEYGHYPPVSHFGHQPQDWNPDSQTDPSDGKLFYVPVSERKGAGPGLEGYIFSKVKKRKIHGTSAFTDYPFPTASYKWAHYLEDIQVSDYSMGTQTNSAADKGQTTYEQYGFIVADPWMSQKTRAPGGGTANDSCRYYYTSSATDNYQSYQLWCIGEDVNDTSDDFWLTGKTHSYETK